MTKKQRLEAAFDLKSPDRTPILGGWIAAPATIATLTGVTEDEYWADPVGVGVRAYDKLGVDGLVGVFTPIKGGYRCVDHGTMEHRAQYRSAEDVVAEIESLPVPEKVERDFDENAEYTKFTQWYDEEQARYGDMLFCPAYWDITPGFMWYSHFGYENYFTALALYPDKVKRLFEHSAATARNRAKLVARAVREDRHPRGILCGQDICTQRGPMVSPAYLDEVYFPLARYSIQPLLEVGAQLVWHCDGDCRPILDAVLDCGFTGLQGFQDECGMRIEDLAKLRTREGKPLLIFGPVSVTTTLVRCTPRQVRRKVREAIEVCRGNASLVLFTSNTINPDVPVENIVAMCEEMKRTA